MKVTVLQENLAKAVTVVSRFVAIRGQLPILANILLSAESGRMKLAATNLELGVMYWVGAKVEEEGRITIPAKVLTELVMSLPKDKVELTVDKEKLKLVCGAYKAEFRGIGASEFPQMEQNEGKSLVDLGVEEFEQAVSQVAVAAATDEGRPVLTGVRWNLGKEAYELAATDGYRLSLKTIKGEVDKKEKLQTDGGKVIIVPARALMEVGHIGKGLGQSGLQVKMVESKDGGQVIFDLGDVQVVARKLAGEFPDFTKIIPKEKKTAAVVATEELAAAVRAAAIFARDSANIIRWKIGKKSLVISANSPQVGENQVEVEAKTEGEENVIAFNSRYLLEILGVIGSKEIRFEMTGALNPGVFKPVGDGSFGHIIMPVRVQEA